jgi:hypothetical protein
LDLQRKPGILGKTMRGWIKNEKGSFSLIEVCISISLIAIILGGMVNLFGQGFQGSRKVTGKITVLNLLREEMENKSQHDTWPPTNIIRENVSDFPGFARQVNCTCPYSGYNDLALINVTVWWDWNGTDYTRNQSVCTLKANY